MPKLARDLLFPLIAVIAAFIVGGILIVLVGDNPITAYRLLLGSALSWPDGIGYTLFHATPLIFTGLAVLVGFRCGLFNIGAEGQLYIAAFATAWVGITFANLSPWLLVPMCFLGTILTGALWGANQMFHYFTEVIRHTTRPWFPSNGKAPYLLRV